MKTFSSWILVNIGNVAFAICFRGLANKLSTLNLRAFKQAGSFAASLSSQGRCFVRALQLTPHLLYYYIDLSATIGSLYKLEPNPQP